MSFYSQYPASSAGGNASVGVNGATAPASSTEIGGVSGGLLVPVSVDVSGNVNVNTVSSALPTGAATAAKQDTGNTSLAAINVSTTAINGKTPALGQAAMAASVPVAIASDQSALPISAASLPLPSGAATSAKQDTGNTSLASIDTKTLAAGQAAMAASSPVVIASNQSSIPVAATLTAETTKVIGTVNIAAAQTIAVTNAGTFATQATLQAGSAIVGKVGIDQSTPGTTNLVALAANQTVNNAQINGVTPLMGNGVTGTGSQRVTIASDNTAFNVKAAAATPTALTVTQAAVTVGTTAVRATVSGSAPAATRVLLVITPDSASTAKFYIGASSVTNSGATRGIQILGGQPIAFNSDAGDYYIISDTAAQTVYIMEQA